MKKTKKVAGYVIAVLMTPVVLATFIGNDQWARIMASTTGVKVSPWFSGGDAARTIEHGDYKTVIHQTVFDGFAWKTSKGFVQVDWTPLEALPPTIEEDVDYDGDGTPDFHVSVDTASTRATLRGFNDRVVSLESCYRLKTRVMVRVNLINR